MLAASARTVPPARGWGSRQGSRFFAITLAVGAYGAGRDKGQLADSAPRASRYAGR